jgi:acyl-coenzyme A thioesterase PaaI-like protein
VTIEIKTQFFAPVRGPQAHCEAKFLHIGRGTCFMESRLIDGDGTLAAAATSTWRVLKPEASGAPGAPGTPVA